MTSWIFFILDIGIIFLIYGLGKWDASFKGNKFFSMTLPEEAFHHHAIEAIKQRYVKQITISFGLMIGLSCGQIMISFSYMSISLMYFFFTLLLSLILPMIWYIKANESTRALKVKEGWEAGAYIRGIHEDDFWIRGILYHNPHDSARQVNKRMGIGLTPNLAYASARWLYFILMVGGISLIVFLCGGLYYMETKVPEYTLEENELVVHYPIYYYRVALNEIQDVKILKEPPAMSKSNGIETDRFARGFFYIEGKGSGYVCVYKHSPCLLLMTKLGVVLINDRSAQGTYDLLEAIDLAHPELEMNYQREDIKR